MAARDLRVEIDLDVRVPMADGMTLNTEVWRPRGGGPVPTIVIRSPYEDHVARSTLDATRALREGFAVVIQQVRGTGRSDGTFEPWVDEAADGAATIAWCAQQPWSNGIVGSLGLSYLAHVQLYAASQRPPALRAMVMEVAPRHPFDLTYVGGALALGSSLGWSLAQAAQLVRRKVTRGEVPASELQLVGDTFDDPAGLLRGPLREIELLRRHFPSWETWLDHPLNDDWWHSRALQPGPSLPTMYVGGWSDIFLPGTLANWAVEPRHPGSRLIIGPWGHSVRSSALGEVAYGISASGVASDLMGEELTFLARHLGAAEPELEPAGDEQSPVRIFVMGANTWRHETAWPPPAARPTDFFLHADGRLGREAPPADAEPARFVFDPRDPVPTIGGRNLLSDSEAAYQVGSWNQASLEHRSDILRFVTEPLTAPTEVTGELCVTLWASTSAIDTDWTAKLIDVHPDGRALNVADGIIRARHRRGADRSDPIEPGRPYEYTIDLAATSQLFAIGHRIRVDISSSNFPRFDLNPGTGKLMADASVDFYVPADQTVYLDATRPSRITLPLIG